MTLWTVSHPLGSSVHEGFPQTRTLEWIAISFSLSNLGIKPRAPSWQAEFLPLSHLGSPLMLEINIQNWNTLWLQYQRVETSIFLSKHQIKVLYWGFLSCSDWEIGEEKCLYFQKLLLQFISGFDSILLSQFLTLLPRNCRRNVRREVLFVAMCSVDATSSLQHFLSWMKRKGLISKYLS